MSQEIVIDHKPMDLVSSHAISCTNDGTYYRSRVFTAHTGVNDLVTAAQAILMLISTLRLTESAPALDELTENLTHEVLTFESRAQQSSYDKTLINLAKFLLIASVSEAISSHYDHRLLKTFYPDREINQCFAIIDHLLCDPVKHRDVIELAFLCLNLGFPSRIHTLQQQTIHVDRKLDQLYRIIRTTRGDKPLALYQPEPEPTVQQRFEWPTRTIIMLCMLTFIFVYCGFAYIIHINTTLLPKSLQPTALKVLRLLEDEDI